LLFQEISYGTRIYLFPVEELKTLPTRQQLLSTATFMQEFNIGLILKRYFFPHHGTNLPAWPSRSFSRTKPVMQECKYI
jgi:hypothetical protein